MLHQLDADTWGIICNFLDVFDLGKCERICTTAKRAIARNNTWQQMWHFVFEHHVAPLYSKFVADFATILPITVLPANNKQAAPNARNAKRAVSYFCKEKAQFTSQIILDCAALPVQYLPSYTTRGHEDRVPLEKTREHGLYLVHVQDLCHVQIFELSTNKNVANLFAGCPIDSIEWVHRPDLQQMYPEACACYSLLVACGDQLQHVVFKDLYTHCEFVEYAPTICIPKAEIRDVHASWLNGRLYCGIITQSHQFFVYADNEFLYQLSIEHGSFENVTTLERNFTVNSSQPLNIGGRFFPLVAEDHSVIFVVDWCSYSSTSTAAYIYHDELFSVSQFSSNRAYRVSKHSIYGMSHKYHMTDKLFLKFLGSAYYFDFNGMVIAPTKNDTDTIVECADNHVFFIRANHVFVDLMLATSEQHPAIYQHPDTVSSCFAGEWYLIVNNVLLY